MVTAAPIECPITENRRAPSWSAAAKRPAAFLTLPYEPTAVASLLPRPRRSSATTCCPAAASRDAMNSKLMRLADRPGTPSTSGASAEPWRLACNRPDSSWISNSASTTAAWCHTDVLGDQDRVSRLEFPDDGARPAALLGLVQRGVGHPLHETCVATGRGDARADAHLQRTTRQQEAGHRRMDPRCQSND